MKPVPTDWLTADDVRAFHDAVLEPENLTGESTERPIEGALDTVINQVMYGESDFDTV